MVFASPCERESASKLVLCVAMAISVLAHVALLLWLELPDQSRRAVPASIPLQIRLMPKAMESEIVQPEPVPEPASPPVVLVREPQPIREPQRGEHTQALQDLLDASSVAPPARISILKQVDDYVADLPLSSEYLPDSTQAEPDNIFHPKLRRALRERGERSSNSVGTLNESTVADAYEWVSHDGKCFRLEDLGGGRGKRAWYPVKCKGSESTSDAMARGLEEALERR